MMLAYNMSMRRRDRGMRLVLLLSIVSLDVVEAELVRILGCSNNAVGR